MIDNNGREDTIKILSDHQLSCMTFIISIQLEDSIIVAADKRNATVDYEVLSDESKKLYTWKVIPPFLIESESRKTKALIIV